MQKSYPQSGPAAVIITRLFKAEIIFTLLNEVITIKNPARYGGVIALSGGLIGDTVSVNDYNGSLEDTPYFVGCSDVDPHIPVERVHASADIMKKLGANVTKRIYPGMGHTVNEDEISHINKMIQKVLES